MMYPERTAGYRADSSLRVLNADNGCFMTGLLSLA
jgi:hypothetical protein